MANREFFFSLANVIVTQFIYLFMLSLKDIHGRHLETTLMTDRIIVF